jgi:hypothetical protein
MIAALQEQGGESHAGFSWSLELVIIDPEPFQVDRLPESVSSAFAKDLVLPVYTSMPLNVTDRCDAEGSVGAQSSRHGELNARDSRLNLYWLMASSICRKDNVYLLQSR